jgi:hypothetical protein
MNAEIPEEKISQLAIDGATDEEICAVHPITVLQLRKRFGAVLKEARARRRLSLRRLQNAAAKKGSAGILSLLGKNELGQDGRKRTGVDRWPEPQLDPKVG